MARAIQFAASRADSIRIGAVQEAGEQIGRDAEAAVRAMGRRLGPLRYSTISRSDNSGRERLELTAGVRVAQTPAWLTPPDIDVTVTVNGTFLLAGPDD